MIDAGRKRPAFFLCGETWWADPAGGAAGGAACGPAFQLAAVPAFHEIAGAGRKGRETGREDRKRGGRAEGMEEDGKLFVKQIKQKRRVSAPRCIILLSNNLLCLFNDLKEVIDIHKTIRKVGIAENINSRFCE